MGNEDGMGLFAPPQIIEGGDNEQENNWDILRIYTDIDEEVEYLEENYMPDEMKWHKKKRKAYNLQKVGYVPMDNSDDSASSIESYEERRGFEGQSNVSHWHQARDAAELGFIPVNEEEEYDAAASKMLHDNKKENIKQKRKQRSERENSVSSKISSIFQRGTDKKKKKKDKKRRRSSTLSKLLSFGSKTDNVGDEDKYEKVETDKNSQQNSEYENDEQEPLSNDYTNEEDDYVDDDADAYYEDENEEEEESETSSERRRRKKKEKKRRKKNKK